LVNAITSRTFCADVVVVDPSTSRSTLAPHVDTQPLRRGSTTGPRRPRGERPPEPDACNTSSTFHDDSPTDSRLVDQRVLVAQPARSPLPSSKSNHVKSKQRFLGLFGFTFSIYYGVFLYLLPFTQVFFSFHPSMGKQCGWRSVWRTWHSVVVGQGFGARGCILWGE
jgi:hypothetical protein